MSTATSNTGEAYDATRRILLADVPGWTGAEAFRRRALPVLPRRVPPSTEPAGDTVAHVLPSRAGQSTGPRICLPRVVPSRPGAGAAGTGRLALIDAAGAAPDAADLQRSSSETVRWSWWRWWWRQDHGQLATECDVDSLPSGNQENAAEVKPGGRHRHR
ncbi:MAG: hypothetical protein M3P91_08665 [Actinomycetota bacterium]|nr:hypothetical protein [Actinomycetota bacterium]